MKCSLCEKNIDEYKPEFHHLVLDANHSADICEGCAHKFVKWQGNILAKLFPTSAMKKRSR